MKEIVKKDVEKKNIHSKTFFFFFFIVQKIVKNETKAKKEKKFMKIELQNNAQIERRKKKRIT